MPPTYRNIVIGTPLTAPSDDTVRAGALVARSAGSCPWLLHVYSPAAYAAEIVDARLLEAQSEKVRAELAAQACRTGLDSLTGFRPDLLAGRIGSPPREILALARHVQADLIVLGGTEGGFLHRAVLGSTADGVIRKASCPVLVVRPGAEFPPVRVEIPVDLSPISAGAFRRGLELLRQIGASLAGTEVLFVLNPVEIGGSLHFSAEQIERLAHAELERFAKANSPGPSPPGMAIRTGYALDEILAVLEERRADLAVLGTHGHGGIERFALGSVAAEVMHRSTCNLLVVPPGAAEDANQEKLKLAGSQTA